MEFEPQGTASDDEETIEKEENEAGIDEVCTHFLDHDLNDSS